MTSSDEAVLLTVHGMEYGEVRTVPTTVGRDVWVLNDLVQEEDVATLLSPQLRPIDCGGRHLQQCFCLGALSQETGHQIWGG